MSGFYLSNDRVGGLLQRKSLVVTVVMKTRCPRANEKRLDQAAVGVIVSGSLDAASAIETPGFTALCRALDRRPLGYRVVKRLLDIVFSLFVIAVCLVPSLILCVAIARETGGSPIYSQVRVGKYGRPFRIYKFRSMVADSDNVEKYLSPEQYEIWQRERKIDHDPRITKLGGILRRLSLDELPQFINVLLGQISVIGPRVITPGELNHFGAQAPRLLSVEPGISGAWQCGPRNLATWESGLRQQIELDYVDRANIILDTKLFFRTIWVMFAKRTGR